MWWAQSIATLNPAAAGRYAADIPLVFKLHMVNGLTILLVLPFTRLVNVWSVAMRLTPAGRAGPGEAALFRVRRL
jgi:nitrate reductase gamma subunit